MLRSVLLLSVVLAQVHAGFSASSLKTNGLLARDAASAPFPANESFVLSWIVQGSSTAESPTAFAIQLTDENTPFSADVTALADTTPLVWNSGRVSLNQTWLQLPANLTKLFVPGSTYKWRVSLYSTASSSSVPEPWSQAVAFDVAPLPASLWDGASWIGGASEVSTEWSIPSSSPIVRARAYASGVGSFQLRINGKQVQDHVMDPGEAVYDQRVLFIGFNVTKLLRQGSQSNTISALLGNSKWGT
jgi:alpha-L-rhamnosidase